MIEEIKKYIDQAADKYSDEQLLGGQELAAYRGFKAGAESMLPIIELLIEQRNRAISKYTFLAINLYQHYIEEYKVQKEYYNKEILKLINGGDDE